MSRVVNPDNTGKLRNQNMRTAAEVIRRLTQKAAFDDEAKDMAATLVFCFRAIDEGIEESMLAWEKRNYWNKVEEFRRQWIWVGSAAARIEEAIRADGWEQIPALIMGLLPRFGEITITKFTRGPDTWQGAHQKLTAERK
jgi:hypothetical protein